MFEDAATTTEKGTLCSPAQIGLVLIAAATFTRVTTTWGPHGHVLPEK